MILTFRTDRSEQTVETQIRDQGPQCWPFHLHLLDALLYGKPPCSNFKMITAIFLGDQIFWILQYTAVMGLQNFCSTLMVLWTGRESYRQVQGEGATDKCQTIHHYNTALKLSAFHKFCKILCVEFSSKLHENKGNWQRQYSYQYYITAFITCTYNVPYEPWHDKTCLREFPTRPDTNRPAQP